MKDSAASRNVQHPGLLETGVRCVCVCLGVFNFSSKGGKTGKMGLYLHWAYTKGIYAVSDFLMHFEQIICQTNKAYIICCRC